MVVEIVLSENGGASLFGGDFFQRDPGESTSETSDEMKKNHHYFGNKPFPPKPLVTVAYVVDGCFFFHVYPNESTLPGFQRYSAYIEKCCKLESDYLRLAAYYTLISNAFISRPDKKNDYFNG